MCFSAGASFTGGVIISAIGVLTVRKVHNPSQIVFACIPLFFGFQQLTEGVLWLTIPFPEYAILQRVACLIFLITALVIWPMMIPFSVFHMEKSARRKKFLTGLLVLGGFLAVYYIYCLSVFNVHPIIKGFHVQYDNDFPKSIANIAFLFYLCVTIIPLFVSSIKRTHTMAILMTLSCLVTAIFFTQYLTSVWCFFAALISGVVYWILSDSHRKFNLEKLQIIRSPFREGKEIR
jgi:hypothetical protein